MFAGTSVNSTNAGISANSTNAYSWYVFAGTSANSTNAYSWYVFAGTSYNSTSAHSWYMFAGTNANREASIIIQQMAVYISNLFFLTSDAYTQIIRDIDLNEDIKGNQFIKQSISQSNIKRKSETIKYNK